MLQQRHRRHHRTVLCWVRQSCCIHFVDAWGGGAPVGALRHGFSATHETRDTYIPSSTITFEGRCLYLQ